MIGIQQLIAAQEEETSISQVKHVVKSKIKDWTKTLGYVSKEAKLLLRERSKLELSKEGLLMRKHNGLEQIVLPTKFRRMIYKQLHEEMGHLGTERVFQLARRRVYWPKMYSDIEEFTKFRCRCNIQQRPRVKPVAPLQSIHSSAPMELVSIDFLHLDKSSGGHEYILLIVDHFTGFAQGYATKTKSSLAAAKHLYNDFIMRFGIPGRILHDQGGEFENKLFAELEKFSGIIKSRTTTYHPQTNGTIERMNSTLLAMLRTLPESLKRKWHESVNKVLFAYNATQHDRTGYSPHFLMFGREPLLPIDVILGIQSQENSSRVEFAKKWREEMQEAYDIVRQKVHKSKQAAEVRWNNNHVIACALLPGDKVLAKNVKKLQGPGKLRNYWEDEIYVVKSVGGEGNVVYTIHKEGNENSTRVVHRNMIKPCELLLREKENEQEDELEVSTSKVRRSPRNALKVTNESAGGTATEEEESEDIELMPDQLKRLAKGSHQGRPIPAPRKKKCPSVPVTSTPYEQERQIGDNEVVVSDDGKTKYAFDISGESSIPEIVVAEAEEHDLSEDVSFAQDDVTQLGDVDADQDNSIGQSQSEDLDEERVDLRMQSQLRDIDIDEEQGEADNPDDDVLVGVDKDIVPRRKSSRKKMRTNFLSYDKDGNQIK